MSIASRLQVLTSVLVRWVSLCLRRNAERYRKGSNAYRLCLLYARYPGVKRPKHDTKLGVRRSHGTPGNCATDPVVSRIPLGAFLEWRTLR